MSLSRLVQANSVAMRRLRTGGRGRDEEISTRCVDGQKGVHRQFLGRFMACGGKMQLAVDWLASFIPGTELPFCALVWSLSSFVVGELLYKETSPGADKIQYACIVMMIRRSVALLVGSPSKSFVRELHYILHQTRNHRDQHSIFMLRQTHRHVRCSARNEMRRSNLITLSSPSHHLIEYTSYNRQAVLPVFL